MNGFKFNSLSDQELLLLKSGGVGVLPTDTVYGLVTQARNHLSVGRLYSLKNRENKPGTVIASSVEQLLNLGIDPTYISKAKFLWPNPISVVVPSDDKLAYLHQGVGSIALRVTADRDLIKLIDITGPLLTSSANQPGEIVANNINEAYKYFGDEVDFYIDGGDLSDRLASTIVAINDKEIRVLREGSIKLNSQRNL